VCVYVCVCVCYETEGSNQACLPGFQAFFYCSVLSFVRICSVGDKPSGRIVAFESTPSGGASSHWASHATDGQPIGMRDPPLGAAGRMSHRSWHRCVTGTYLLTPLGGKCQLLLLIVRLVVLVHAIVPCHAACCIFSESTQTAQPGRLYNVLP
jgi:hypothetical protein